MRTAARSTLQAILAAAMTLCFALPAVAAVPTSTLVEGVLTSSGGTPAADGDYQVTFALYAASSGGSATWTEGPVKVTITGGRFHYAMGATKAITATALAGMTEAWLGIKVGADPELPRQKLEAVPYAINAAWAASAAKLECDGCLDAQSYANGSIASAKIGFNYAGSSTKGGPALDLECSGCVKVSELTFDGDVDLAGNSLKAKNGTFSGDVVAKTVTATSFVGDGSKLTGIKIPSGTCSKAGEVVKGINADGTLNCVAALDPSALPKDGLNEISNDLITNQFIDTISADVKNVPIPDFTGTEGVSNLTFPDIGIAQTIEVTVHVTNTNLNKLSLVLLPPDDKKTGYTLCDPCAADDTVKIFKVSYPPTKQKSGDVTDWVGKNPKGLWNLKAKDVEYCVPQKPGNAPYCDTTKKTDGLIVDWSIKIQTLSNQKVSFASDILANKDAIFSNGITIKASTGTCDAAHKGQIRWLTGKGMMACNGSAWVTAAATPAVYQGYCTLARYYVSNWNWYCLNKTTINTATDYLTVSAYAPPNGTTSNTYDAQWQGAGNPNKIGRIDVKIAGYYRITWHVRAQPYLYWDTQILVNGTGISYAQTYRPSTYVDDTHHHSKVVKLAAGNTIDFRSYPQSADNTSNYAWLAGPESSFVEVEYLGTDW